MTRECNHLFLLKIAALFVPILFGCSSISGRDNAALELGTIDIATLAEHDCVSPKGTLNSRNVFRVMEVRETSVLAHNSLTGEDKTLERRDLANWQKSKCPMFIPGTHGDPAQVLIPSDAQGRPLKAK